MSDYDFGCLNDKEFEDLSVHLLSARFGRRVERFKAGRDGGVDGRFFCDSNSEVVIQCKHWIKSGLDALLRHIKKTEAKKVDKIKPKRYIFVTSLPLSRANKLKIKELFFPFILRDDDVLGNEDINDLLLDYPEIEKQHYKLWITSTNVLETVLNAAIAGRSRHKMEEIIKNTKRYVVTRSHEQALEKLEEKHSIIITGAPGVGKTTLADQVCQSYSANEFELCFIENSLNEAESHYSESRKQVFYFDDFLGRNFLNSLSPHEDSHVVNFIKRVERDPKKRFVLTSRSNVLNQGKRLSELFNIENVDKNEYEVTISSLTDMDKAKILYNHIWFGHLEGGYVDQIYKNRRYHEIIKHRNFNPRLISFITDYLRLEGISCDDYWDYIEGTLDNPIDIWRHVFEVQTDEMCRHVVVAVVIHGVTISEPKLRQFYSRLATSPLGSSGGELFGEKMRLLVGALLNRVVINRDYVGYSLFNPSIADYVISEYIKDVDYLSHLLACLASEQSVDNVRGLSDSGVLDRNNCRDLIEGQINRFSRRVRDAGESEYFLALLVLYSEIVQSREEILEFVVEFARSNLDVQGALFNNNLYVFYDWALGRGLVEKCDSRLSRLVNRWVDNGGHSNAEFASISNILVEIEPEGGGITDAFKVQIVDYYSDEITGNAIEAGIFQDAYDNDSISGDEIQEFVEGEVEEIAVELGYQEIAEICNSFDVSDIITSNIDALKRDNQEDNKEWEKPEPPFTRGASSVCAIDELFERD